MLPETFVVIYILHGNGGNPSVEIVKVKRLSTEVDVLPYMHQRFFEIYKRWCPLEWMTPNHYDDFVPIIENVFDFQLEYSVVCGNI
jgi:hypothetical protein